MLFCLARTLAQVIAMTALWDYENWLLSKYNIELSIPVGMERLTHESWVQHVKNDLPESNFTWAQYVQHVEAGDGDEWFFEREPPRESLNDHGQ